MPDGKIRIDCAECGFSEIVERGGKPSATAIVTHGRETGHKLSIEVIDDSD